MIYGTGRNLADIIGPDPVPAWRIEMPETLDAGGSGLGRDIADADTVELNKWDIDYPALKENAELRKSVLAMQAEIAGLWKRSQWLTLGLFVAFAFGFLMACLLIGVAR
jgi:hypothetical protein